MQTIIFYFILKFSDNCIFEFFFHSSKFEFINMISNFYIEIILTIYILYNIIFFTDKKLNYKLFYFQFIFFIFFLFTFSILDLIFMNNGVIWACYLINNKFILSNKCFILFSLIIILLIIKNKMIINPKLISLNELPIIFSFLLLFIFILFSTYDLFVIYLTIEGISLIIYSLGSLMNESLINLESIIKYFLINNLASSILLWCVSYLYILAGTTDCFELKFMHLNYAECIQSSYLYYISLLFVLSLFIKLALFPFQWWIADIFEGFWTPITLCYAILIKYTFFILLFKLITNIFSPIIYLFQPYIWVAATGSIILGSLAALIQVKLKRFLAYTSIAQSGYIVIGLSCNSLNGFLSSFLYLIMYCIVTLSFFCILLNTEHISKGHNMVYFNQLYSLFIFNKEISFHTIVIIFVMAAIPPFTSFFAKLFIFIVSLEAKLELITCIILAISLISTFYYLNFIQQLIFYKINNYKIFYYKENIILNYFLRLNTVFFTLGIIIIAKIYDYSLHLLLLCMYPLTCN